MNDRRKVTRHLTVTLRLKRTTAGQLFPNVSRLSPCGVEYSIWDDPSENATQSPSELTEAERRCPARVRKTNDRPLLIRPSTVSLARPRRNVIREVPGSTIPGSTFVIELATLFAVRFETVGWGSGRSLFCSALALVGAAVGGGSGPGFAEDLSSSPSSFVQTRYAPAAPANPITNSPIRAIAKYFRYGLLEDLVGVRGARITVGVSPSGSWISNSLPS